MGEREIAMLTDAEFDALHGGRELLPIEQAAYEAERAERFARYHGHGRSFPAQAENFATRAAASLAPPTPSSKEAG